MATSKAQTSEGELDRQKAQTSAPSLWTRKTWVLAPLACALFGLLISVMPHLVSWAHTGSALWIADDDEPGYLSYASQAYFNHPAYLSDPVFASGGKTMYPWLQLIPGVLAAKFFGLGPFGISLVWRTWAGISIGIGWYLLASVCTRSRWITSAVALMMLADAGVFWGQPLRQPLVIAGRVLMGREGDLFDNDPNIHPEWRLITPALSLFFLLLHIWLVLRAREDPNRARILLAGTGFGLLFYVYFYYWTAAFLALVTAFVLDGKNRRLYFYTASLGTALGLPALLATFLLKRSASPDWLIRMDFGGPIPHFSELIIPRTALVLLPLLLLWVWKRRKDLIYVWALALSGILLSNHQILSGVQIQNFHWRYVWGPCLAFLLLLAVADLVTPYIQRKGPILAVLLLMLVVHLTTGIWLRVVEAEKTKVSNQLTQSFHHFDQQTRDHPAHFRANSVIAGDGDFVAFAVITNNLRPLDHYAVYMSPFVDDAELNDRVALNAFLLGEDRSTFAKKQDDFFVQKGWSYPESRDRARRTQRVESQTSAYDRVAADLSQTLNRFAVRYVALPRNGASAPAYLTSDWRRVVDGPYCQIWERE